MATLTLIHSFQRLYLWEAPVTYSSAGWQGVASLPCWLCVLQVPGTFSPKGHNLSLVIQAALERALNQDSGLQHQQLQAAHGQGWLTEGRSRGNDFPSGSHLLMQVVVGWTQNPRWPL